MCVIWLIVAIGVFRYSCVWGGKTCAPAMPAGRAPAQPVSSDSFSGGASGVEYSTSNIILWYVILHYMILCCVISYHIISYYVTLLHQQAAALAVLQGRPPHVGHPAALAGDLRNMISICIYIIYIYIYIHR